MIIIAIIIVIIIDLISLLLSVFVRFFLDLEPIWLVFFPRFEGFRFYRVSLVFAGIVPSFTGFYLVLLNLTEFYCHATNILEFYMALPSFLV